MRDALSQGHWDRAVALLQQLDPAAAADVMMGLPFEEQQVLFRIMPDDFAAFWSATFPTTTPTSCSTRGRMENLRAIIDKMKPGERTAVPR